MTDTSPKRLRELADSIYPGMPAPRSKEVRELLLALAAEKENPGPVCSTCGSDCNERDELIKAEREIERLRGLLAEKEAQHPDQPLEMVKPADVPLPEPVALVGDVYSLHWYGSGPIDVIVNKHGIKPGGILVTAHQSFHYGQACAKAARDAAFEECANVCKEIADRRGEKFFGQVVSDGSATQCYRAIQAAKRGET